MRRRIYQTGVSLLEIILITAVAGILILVLAALPAAISSINKSRRVSLAKDVALRQIDDLRRIGYANLANGTTSFTDSDLNQLSNAAASYEISDCSETICTAAEKAKSVKVTVSWTELGDSKTTQIETLVGQGGIGQ